LLDENVVQPIEPPRLDRQSRRTHALLDECDTLLAQGVQERSTSTQHASDGQLDALDVAPQPQVADTFVRPRRR
jgi:hypothetical protein